MLGEASRSFSAGCTPDPALRGDARGQRAPTPSESRIPPRSIQKTSHRSEERQSEGEACGGAAEYRPPARLRQLARAHASRRTIATALEGEWKFVGLQVDGTDVPAAMTAQSRLLIDGDRFRMESPEANYEGTFRASTPASSRCASTSRSSRAGSRPVVVRHLRAGRRSAHDVSRRRRGDASGRVRVDARQRPRARTARAERPWRGRTAGDRRRQPDAGEATTRRPPRRDAASFDVPMTPLLEARKATGPRSRSCSDGAPLLKADWLPFGSRTTSGNVVKVVFGGQVMVHAKMKIRRARDTDRGRLPEPRRQPQGPCQPRHHGLGRRRSPLRDRRTGRSSSRQPRRAREGRHTSSR